MNLEPFYQNSWAIFPKKTKTFSYDVSKIFGITLASEYNIDLCCTMSLFYHFSIFKYCPSLILNRLYQNLYTASIRKPNLENLYNSSTVGTIFTQLQSESQIWKIFNSSTVGIICLSIGPPLKPQEIF